MVDYQAKYESLLRNVLSDLNSEVIAAQGRAEKNAEGERGIIEPLSSHPPPPTLLWRFPPLSQQRLLRRVEGAAPPEGDGA